MLLDRVDAIFLTKKASIELLNNPQKKAFKILEALTQQVYLYHFINKKHDKLIPLITKKLKLIESAGQINLKAHSQ